MIMAAELLQNGSDDSSDERNDGRSKDYDYLLKFLLVGDSDVGKDEILNAIDESLNGGIGARTIHSASDTDRSTTLLLEGRRVKLLLWNASGQGRFDTIIRTHSRGAQGILLVYDITNKWSFQGIHRWIEEINKHAPGVPKVLLGNRLHLAFKRQVGELEADELARHEGISFFEVSPLVDYNIKESLAELSQLVLRRNGVINTLRPDSALSLEELSCRVIVSCTTIYGIERLPLPRAMKDYLKSYALTNTVVSFLQRGGASGTLAVDRGKRRSLKYLNAREQKHSRKTCAIS